MPADNQDSTTNNQALDDQITSGPLPFADNQSEPVKNEVTEVAMPRVEEKKEEGISMTSGIGAEDSDQSSVDSDKSQEVRDQENEKVEVVPPPTPIESPEPVVVPEENVAADQGTKDISLGVKNVGGDVEEIALQIKPKNKVRPAMITGLIGLVLLTVGAAIVALNFGDFSGDLRQRASGGPGTCTIAGMCLGDHLCTQADVNAGGVSVGSGAFCGNFCLDSTTARCVSQNSNCIADRSGGHCSDPFICSPNIITCGGGGTCSSGEARRCNETGQGWATGCFVDSRCGGTTATPTPAPTQGTSGGTGGGATPTPGTSGGTGGGGTTGSNLPSCVNEGVVLSWTDKAGVKHATGEMSVPFNPTEKFYASNCTAKTSGWSLLASPDTNFSRVVFSITDASGKDPNLVSSYIDAEVGAVYNTLYLTCRKGTQDCGSMQLVRGAATTPTPIPTPTSTIPVAMCVAVKAWVQAPGQGCLPTPNIGECVQADWKETPFNQLGTVVKVGDTIRLTVAGNNVGVFSKARFSMNGGTPVETTAKYGSDYYFDYLVDRGGNFSVTAELFR